LKRVQKKRSREEERGKCQNLFYWSAECVDLAQKNPSKSPGKGGNCERKKNALRREMVSPLVALVKRKKKLGSSVADGQSYKKSELCLPIPKGKAAESKNRSGKKKKPAEEGDS